MKVAVTSRADDPAVEMDSRFGRAGFYLLHDTATGNWQSVVNEFAGVDVHGSGSGARAAANLCALGVRAVITGHVCDKALRVLTRADVKVYRGSKLSATEAVAALASNQLDEIAPTPPE
jgi:predicted Fe-Mo cluster-binding NifX family protein